MDFLGAQSAELRKIKSDVIALEALLTSIVAALPPETKIKAAAHFKYQAEKTQAEWLNSMATDSLFEELHEKLQSLEQIFKP